MVENVQFSSTCNVRARYIRDEYVRGNYNGPEIGCEVGEDDGKTLCYTKGIPIWWGCGVAYDSGISG